MCGWIAWEWVDGKTDRQTVRKIYEWVDSRGKNSYRPINLGGHTLGKLGKVQTPKVRSSDCQRKGAFHVLSSRGGV